MGLVFRPVGIAAGIFAGIVGKKIFDLIWGLIDDEDAPEPRYRQIAFGKLVAALILEGAIFRVLRGLADHGARHGFARLTGEWPGQEHPDED
jgi:uncharacterized protein DUF4235